MLSHKLLIVAGFYSRTFYMCSCFDCLRPHPTDSIDLVLLVMSWLCLYISSQCAMCRVFIRVILTCIYVVFLGVILCQYFI